MVSVAPPPPNHRLKVRAERKSLHAALPACLRASTLPGYRSGVSIAARLRLGPAKSPLISGLSYYDGVNGVRPP
jgi:hypothetical protein